MVKLKKVYTYIKYGFQYLRYKAFKKSKKYKKSRCENLIECWLKINKVNYHPQYKIEVPKNIRKSGKCYIDFIVKTHENIYAIEYNGRQHYEFTPYFHKSLFEFKAQQKRDKYIENWCKEKGVIFVEIPYTLSDDQIIAKLKEITE